MGEIGTAIQGAIGYLTQHPDEAAYTDTAATARLKAGLRVVTTGPGSESVATDMVAAVGGGGTAPSPGWLLRAAAASCVATLIAMRAAMLGLTLTELQVTVDSRSDDRGILGLDPAVPAGPSTMRVAVAATSRDASREDIDELVRWSVDHCPVTDAVRRAVPLTVEVA
jgi:uncharacterized OsmC-like protein